MAGFLLAGAADAIHAATINITTYGASPTNTDNFTQITNAINAAIAGDTVYFPAGTYNISSALTFKASVTFSGQGGAILNLTSGSGYCFGTTSSSNSNITVTGLTFQGGGIIINNTTVAQNFTMTGCTIQNITSTTYPQNEGMYINSQTSNLNIVGNYFKNIPDGVCIDVHNTSGMHMDDNIFDTVYQPTHVGGPCTNSTIARNIGTAIHRMGAETQGSGYVNFLVEDNHFSHWDNAFWDSFGLSIIPIGSGMSEITQYNTLLGRPRLTNRYGYGIEVGQSNVVQNNFVEGLFCNGIVIGGANASVLNNVLRGPNDNTLNEHATSISYEPGGDPNTATISGNSQTVTSTYLENPTNLTSTILNGDQVKLTWVNNDANQTGVEVQRHIPGGAYSVLATGLAGTTATFTDVTAAPNTRYAYRIRVYDGSGNLTYSPAVLAVTGAAAPIKFEAESLSVAAQTTGITYRVVADARFSGGSGSFFDSTATGQFVTFDLPNVAAGTYDVRVGYKAWNNKGIFQVAASRLDQQGSASNVGSPVDSYSANEVFTEVDLGSWTPASTSDKAFKFTVTGKNSSSAGYGLAIDYITLIPQ